MQAMNQKNVRHKASNTIHNKVTALVTADVTHAELKSNILTLSTRQ